MTSYTIDQRKTQPTDEENDSLMNQMTNGPTDWLFDTALMQFLHTFKL